MNSLSSPHGGKALIGKALHQAPPYWRGCGLAQHPPANGTRRDMRPAGRMPGSHHRRARRPHFHFTVLHDEAA